MLLAFADESPLAHALAREMDCELAFIETHRFPDGEIKLRLPPALPPRVVVLLVQGDLVQGDSFTVPLLGRQVTGDRTLTKEIERLRKDPSVRALVVRIDSPGGDVGAAEAIARELDLVRKERW